MKANFQKEKNMEKGSITIKVGSITLGTGQIIRRKVMGYTSMTKINGMKASLKIT